MRTHPFRKSVICALCAVAALLAATALGAPETSRPPDEQMTQKALEALDALSPSNPDPRDLAALFQMRTAFQDENLRRNIEDLVAVGFVIAKRQDVYAKRVRPALTDPLRIEKEGQKDCPACKGSGQNTIKCGRCGGLGHCSVCNGTGKKRVKESLLLKGPAHQKPREETKEISCSNCKGTGSCPDCHGEGNRRVGCPKCLGAGKIWDHDATIRIAKEAHDALHAALKLRHFEDSIPKSIATVSADGVRTLGPVFTFGDIRVVAIPARAATGVSGLSVYSHDKHPIPFSSVLAAKNRDLVLVDLGQSSIVTPLELETEASNLDMGRHVYAYGTSRENDMVARLDGKILAAGPAHISTSIASKSLADCAPLITDDGKLGGVFMYPMAEFNSFGTISLTQNDGSAMRFDNLIPTDFVRVSVGDLGLCNNVLTFAKRAIQSGKELLEMDNEALSQRLSSITDAIKRLDRAVAMLKGVRQWNLFMMEATAKELSDESEVRARNLEARIVQIKEGKLAAARAARDAAEQGTNVMETVAAPMIEDETPAKSAKKPSASSGKKASASNKKNKKPVDAAEEGDMDFAIPDLNWRKIITITVIVIVAITVIFILMGKIQDMNRKRKLAEPPKIPDFIREMQEYERKHPEKKK